MLPLWASVQESGVEFGLVDLLAGVVGFAAVFCQATADDQLRDYRQAKPPRAGDFGEGIADVGLWRYSRHPNYCGELGHWFSYAIFAVGAGVLGTEHAWMLGGWVPLLFLFVGASIPMMEERQLKSKTRYAEYQQAVSMFLPMPRSQIRKKT